MAYWQNKVCLVTGSSAGLGLAIGEALSRRGAKVVLNGRRQDALDAAADKLRKSGSDVHALPGDVAWQEDVDRISTEVSEKFGGIDVLCNCAGRSARGAALDTTPEDFQQLFEVNFLATVRMTRAFAPLLLKRRGHLVNIGSLASKVGAEYMGAYPASKFAVAAYTQQLRLELADQGLHVMLVCPGPIAQGDAGVRYAEATSGVPATAQAPGAGARISAIDPAKLAEAILNGCEARKAELVVPGKAKLLFAISQLSARLGDWLLSRSMNK